MLRKLFALVAALAMLVSACTVKVPALGIEVNGTPVPPLKIEVKPQGDTPTPDAVPSEPTDTSGPVSTSKCVADKDYQLQDLPEVATAGSFLHVEFWSEGQPEREAILAQGRYELTSPLKGHVWEYSLGCTEEDIKSLVDEHIARRLADRANNAGWADSELVKKLFDSVH